MASTYNNNLRLNEMGTGDQSGTWGVTTNTNLSLITDAFSYQTEATFSSDADVTATVADGASDKYRAIYVKVTSGVSLTATRTLTIAPNTISKIIIIENATSGSQSITISQGSGASITVANGNTKVLMLDGGGSSAVVYDAFNNLALTSDLTIEGDDLKMGTNTSGHVLVADGTNFNPVAMSGDATIAANGAITIANDAVEQSMIADDAVGTDQLASNSVVNASVSASAAIAFSKMADLTTSRALVSDGSGDVSVSDVTSTELGYLDGVTSAIQTQIDAKTTLAAVYPVGSIYINATNNTNPATLLGFGTWAAFGAGRVMVGLNSGDSDFDAAEETGGAKTSALPNHTHQWYDGTRSGSGSGIDFFTGAQSGSFNSSGSADNFSGDPDTGDYYTANPSSSPNISTIQPYIVVYMWKRTA